MKHYEENALISAAPKAVFAYADDPKHFSAHMSQSSWMMGGGHMETQVDGTHIRLKGKVMGFNLWLDEVVTRYEPPQRKEWQTVGDINLLVIGHYKMGFEIKPDTKGSRIKIFIDYDLPKSYPTRWLGYLFGDFYARWCIKQMINGVKENFNK